MTLFFRLEPMTLDRQVEEVFQGLNSMIVGRTGFLSSWPPAHIPGTIAM
jgi:hypothetical protein